MQCAYLVTVTIDDALPITRSLQLATWIGIAVATDGSSKPSLALHVLIFENNLTIYSIWISYHQKYRLF